MKALNVYRINIIQNLKFMHKTKYGINPRIFLHKFREEDHQYPRRYSQNSFYFKKFACTTTNFAITLRRPTIWNSFLSQHEKSISHLLSFLKQIKFKLNSRPKTHIRTQTEATINIFRSKTSDLTFGISKTSFI